MRIAVTGGRGQLGQAIVALAGATVLEVDVRDEVATLAAVQAVRPDVVVNCAAYVDVDGAEGRGAAAALAVNTAGAANVARAARRAGARTVYVSTNYVFDGDRPEPYDEYDIPSPRSMYGISKLAGEHATTALDPDALIVRTAALYGFGGSRAKGGSFVERIIEAAVAGRPLSIVVDQWISPTSCCDLANAIADCLDRSLSGVLHLTNDGTCSWHEFAVAALQIVGIEATVVPIATHLTAGRAPRPANGVLGRARADILGIPRLRSWHEALAAGLLSVERVHPSGPTESI